MRRRLARTRALAPGRARRSAGSRLVGRILPPDRVLDERRWVMRGGGRHAGQHGSAGYQRARHHLRRASAVGGDARRAGASRRRGSSAGTARLLVVYDHVDPGRWEPRAMGSDLLTVRMFRGVDQVAMVADADWIDDLGGIDGDARRVESRVPRRTASRRPRLAALPARRGAVQNASGRFGSLLSSGVRVTRTTVRRLLPVHRLRPRPAPDVLPMRVLRVVQVECRALGPDARQLGEVVPRRRAGRGAL